MTSSPCACEDTEGNIPGVFCFKPGPLTRKEVGGWGRGLSSQKNSGIENKLTTPCRHCWTSHKMYTLAGCVTWSYANHERHYKPWPESNGKLQYVTGQFKASYFYLHFTFKFKYLIFFKCLMFIKYISVLNTEFSKTSSTQAFVCYQLWFSRSSPHDIESIA